jgi:Arc/MetJ-type ribon-helix-helix transcriptional regulator
MDIVLSPELERLVQESIARGEFSSRDEFFDQAARLLLARSVGEPIPVDERWDSHVEALVQEAEASGEAAEMTDGDWQDIESQGLAQIQQQKRS